MKNYLVRTLAHNGFVRVCAVQATNIVVEAQRRRGTWHTSSAVLKRTLVGGSLLGITSRRKGKLAVRIQGDGPAAGVVVDANGKGDVRGYIRNSHLSLPLNSGGKIDARGAIGTQGMSTVIKDLGLKEPFPGQAPIVSGEIVKDFIYYLAISEQVPSTAELSVLANTDDSVKTAGGFIVQIMSGVDEETVSKIEEQLETTPRISTLLGEEQTPEEVSKGSLSTEELNVLEKMPVQFKYGCSKEKLTGAIIVLGVEEIQAMIDEDHGAEAVCSFCNNKYKHSEEELAGLEKEALGGI